MAMSASHVLSAGTIAGAGALRSSGRAASAAAEMRTLALGQANSFVPQRDVVLRVSQGAAWVTLGLGMSNEAGQKAGDVVLQAGQTLQLKAGQSVVLEGKGAKVGLVTTTGYRDIMQIARSYVPGGLAAWIVWPKPQPLARLEHTVEVPGRMDAQGREVAPLDEDAVRAALRKLSPAL